MIISNQRLGTLWAIIIGASLYPRTVVTFLSLI